MSSAAAKDHEASPEVNYFVCTLGQAASFNHRSPHSFRTVNGFLDAQAQAIPHSPAVGFPTLTGHQKDEAEWDYLVLSAFVELDIVSIV